MNKKKINVYVQHHMDLVWRRAFYRRFLFAAENSEIASYSLMEENAIRQSLDMCESTPYIFSVEQVHSLKNYLLNNPDETERVQRAVKNGRLEMLGQGICAIDTNLCCGEAILRNQIYGIEYDEKMFSCRPTHVNVTDLFGLSAQLPQIYRLCGYSSITQYSRVFRENKPFWRGLSGDVVVLGTCEDRTFMLNFGGYKAWCPVCSGKGCAACGYSGTDMSYPYDVSDLKKRLEVTLSQWKNDGKSDDLNIMLQTEEGMHEYGVLDVLDESIKKFGFDYEFRKPSQVYNELYGKYIKMLENGDTPKELIDSRIEGNPMATGCYSSRIRLKQQNRLAERALISAEKLCAFAKDAYPEKKLRKVWEELFFTQFHDCVTGSQCDEGYRELLDAQADILYSSYNMALYAAKSLEKRITVADISGKKPFILFNMTPYEGAWIQQYSFHTPDASYGFSVADCDGKTLPVYGTEYTKAATGYFCTVSFLAEIPANGYSVFYLQTIPAADNAAVGSGLYTIENEYMRISPDGAYDKASGRKLLKSPLKIFFDDDDGDAWGRTSLCKKSREIPLKAVLAEKAGGCSVLRFNGEYSADKGTASLKAEIKLYDGMNIAFVRIESDNDFKAGRLCCGFETVCEFSGRAIYEIPFGSLEREMPNPEKLTLGYSDEWPCVNWFACTKDACAVTVFNRGLPGASVCESGGSDMLKVTLCRAPVEQSTAFDNSGVLDKGHHVFELALRLSGTECLRSRNTAAGIRFNTEPFCIKAREKTGELPARGAFLPGVPKGVTADAAFLTENGVTVRMTECDGLFAESDECFTECDAFGNIKEQKSRLKFKPYEIKTAVIG